MLLKLGLKFLSNFDRSRWERTCFVAVRRHEEALN